MEGQPSDFEAIRNRLGFRIAQVNERYLKLSWQGPKFPAVLCLAIALALIFVSLPIFEAIRIRGFVGPAASLWYFPLMNIVLFGISLYLLSLRRTVILDGSSQRVLLSRQTLFSRRRLHLAYGEVAAVKLGLDQVYSGFAMAGSSAAQTFPVPSLRLITGAGQSVLLDRGNRKNLEALGELISERLQKPLEMTLPPLK